MRGIMILVIQVILTALIPTAMIMYGIYRHSNIPSLGKAHLIASSKRSEKTQEALSFQYSFLSHMLIITGLNVAIVSEIFLISSIILLRGYRWITVFSLIVMQFFSVLLNVAMSRYVVRRKFDREGNLKEEKKLEKN